MCQQCGKQDLRRNERVIRRWYAQTNYLCGACAHTWKEQDQLTALNRSRSDSGRQRSTLGSACPEAV